MMVLAQIGGGAAPAGALDMVFGGALSTELILAIMAGASLASWIIIFWKLGQFRRVRRQGRRFVAAIERSQRLDEAYKSILRLPESPYAAVFREGVNFYEELRPGSLREGAVPGEGLSDPQLEALHGMMDKEEDAQIETLEGGLVWLAVIGAVAPLLGLLGTVIGIMHAFLGIGTAAGSSISAVAPGIAEALVTTAGGLVVAIPALLAYNLFVQRMKSFDSELQGFANEFVGALAREGKL